MRRVGRGAKWLRINDILLLVYYGRGYTIYVRVNIFTVLGQFDEGQLNINMCCWWLRCSWLTSMDPRDGLVVVVVSGYLVGPWLTAQMLTTVNNYPNNIQLTNR